jgi:phage baseplate assembly protein W
MDRTRSTLEDPVKAMSYPFRIDSHGKVAATTDTRRIWMDRVRSLLNTEVGDRVNRPELGLDSNAAVLNMGSPAEFDFTAKITESFARLLPTLMLNSVTSDMDSSSGVLTVEVVFTCPDRQIVQTSVSFASGLLSSETTPYEVLL